MLKQSRFFVQGCFGATVGKAKQAAKIDIEKIKIEDMTVERSDRSC